MHVVSPHLPVLWLHGQRASGLLLAFRAPEGSTSLSLSSPRHRLLLAACLAPQHAYPWQSSQLQQSKKCVFCDVPSDSSYSFSKIKSKSVSAVKQRQRKLNEAPGISHPPSLLYHHSWPWTLLSGTREETQNVFVLLFHLGKGQLLVRSPEFRPTAVFCSNLFHFTI